MGYRQTKTTRLLEFGNPLRVKSLVKSLVKSPTSIDSEPFKLTRIRANVGSSKTPKRGIALRRQQRILLRKLFKILDNFIERILIHI